MPGDPSTVNSYLAKFPAAVAADKFGFDIILMDDFNNTISKNGEFDVDVLMIGLTNKAAGEFLESVPADITWVTETGKGYYRISMQPDFAGEYEVEVVRSGQLVGGTTYQVEILPGATDPGASEVAVPEEVVAGETITVAVQAKDAGGNLKIDDSDSGRFNVNYKVLGVSGDSLELPALGNGKYSASFSVTTTPEVIVDVTYNALDGTVTTLVSKTVAVKAAALDAGKTSISLQPLPGFAATGTDVGGVLSDLSGTAGLEGRFAIVPKDEFGNELSDPNLTFSAAAFDVNDGLENSTPIATFESSYNLATGYNIAVPLSACRKRDCCTRSSSRVPARSSPTNPTWQSFRAACRSRTARSSPTILFSGQRCLAVWAGCRPGPSPSSRSSWRTRAATPSPTPPRSRRPTPS